MAARTMHAVLYESYGKGAAGLKELQFDVRYFS